jgi:UPF0716 family protein affecting phage T7 exclusion
VTDTIGFALLIPPFRAAFKTIIAKHTQFSATTIHRPQQRPGDPNVIEGEYERVDEDK